MQKFFLHIFILLLLTKNCFPQGVQHPQLPNPSGFSEVLSDRGVTLYSNNATRPVYIQLIDLNLGAHIVLLQTNQVNPSGSYCGISVTTNNNTPLPGIFGSVDPHLDKESIQYFWDDLSLLTTRAFSVINGGYFDCGINGIGHGLCEANPYSNAFLSYPSIYNGQIVSGGHDCEMNKVLRSLEINYTDNSVKVSDFFRPSNPSIFKSITSSEFTGKDVFVGISPGINLIKNFSDSRNYIGMINSHTIAILQGEWIKPSEAIQIMSNNCGIPTEHLLETDGGGSQKLMRRGESAPLLTGTGNLSSFRHFPQAIGVLAGSEIIKLDGPITLTPLNVNQCDLLSVSTNIKNDGSGNWNGKIYISLHKGNGDFMQDLMVAPNISIPTGAVTTVSVSTALNTIPQITVGSTYKIYIKYQTDGTIYPNEYPIVKSGNYLNPATLAVNYSPNCNDVVVLPGNYKSVFLSGLNLNSQTNELEFLLQGITAQPGDPIINIADESLKIKKRFKQALVIPEDNQWISLNINQSNIGDAATGANFQNTDLAKDCFEADVKLKFSSVFKPVTGFTPYTGTFTDWNNLILQGPYLSELQAQQFLFYPYWGVFAGVHSKNLNYNSQGSTKIIINNADMEMHDGILWTELDNSINNLSSNLRNTLLLKINPYRTQLLQRLNNGLNITTPLINSSGVQFQQLRNTYRITAAAHWYKTLTNYPNKPYQNLINSNNLNGITVSPPYNKAYWDGQALQPLPQLYETYNKYNNQGSAGYSCVGGVSLGAYTLIDSGALNSSQVAIDSICFKNKSYTTIDTVTYLYGGILDRDIPELSPVLTHINQPHFVVGDTISVKAVIYNFGNVKAQNFPVRLYEQYINSQNQIQNVLIGQQNIAMLDSFSNQQINFSWIPQNFGNKKLFVTVDEGNVIVERTENNNSSIDSVYIQDNLPLVQILSPNAGAAIGNLQITFTGSATDKHDDFLQGNSLTWSSDRDGFLGNGSLLTVDSLSTGAHVIEFTATNSRGQSASTYLNIFATPQGYPLISILSPSNNDTLPSNVPVLFSGDVSDITEGSLCDSAVWSSDINGVLGNSCDNSHLLSPGSHTIKLTATNTGGKTSVATVHVYVADGLPHLSIIQPSGSASFYQHQPVILKASAHDFPQGNISDSVKWYSNLQGYLGTGQTVTILLQKGNHIITAVVGDNAGSFDTATIAIDIKFTPPVPFIIQPQPNQIFNFHDTLALIGHATDLQDGVLHGSHLRWFSDINGFLGTGDTVITSSLSYGSHIVSLEAVDSNGADSTITVINIFIDAGQPACSIIQPVNGGSFFFGNSIAFKGLATDPQNGLLTGTHLQWYSNLNGNFGSGDSVSTHLLNAGNHIISLTATDNDGFSTTATRNIVVQAPHPPVVSVYWPASNSHFLNGTPVILKASAADYEEGILNNNRVTWSSSINGNLGTGKTITVNNLVPGNHVISATAIDTTGLTTTVTIQVIVDQRKPEATITSPAPGAVFAQGTTITFTGTATDFEEGILSGNSLQWNSAANINLGSGNTLNTATLTPGSHLIKLIATDAQNAKDTTDVLVVVQAPHTVLLKTFSSGTDSISHLFTSGQQDTIIYAAIPKGAIVLNAQAKMTGRTDLMAAVTITANPPGVVACGSNITFTAAYTNGGTNPSFQWQVNGLNVGTNSSTFSSNTLLNGDRIKVIMTSNLNNVSETHVSSNIILINCN